MKTVVQDEVCFLCHTILIKGENRSDEHIFDKALLRYLKIFENEITFQNGDHFKYSQSKIACCIKCNRDKLKPVWDRVFVALKKGPNSVRNDVSKSDLYVWLAKVYYGLLIRDTKTKQDKANPDSVKIASKDQVNKNILLRYMIDVLREDSEDKLIPGSIMVYECQDSKNQRFWFADTFNPAYIAIKIECTLIVAFLHDFKVISNVKFPSLPINVSNVIQLNDLHIPTAAKKLSLSYLEAIELSVFYATLASLLFPVEVHIYPKEGRVGHKFIGARLAGESPMNQWNHELFLQLKRRNRLPEYPLILTRYVENLMNFEPDDNII